MLKDFDAIVYHSVCSDGTSSLWCANHYKNINEKIPCYAGKNPTMDCLNKNILFVDLCPSIDFIKENSLLCKNIVILDHHASSKNIYEENVETFNKLSNVIFIFDMNRSGCQITWDYFFGDLSRPWFIDYIADRDLWLWKLEFSKEINASFFENNLIDDRNLDKMTELLLNDSVDVRNKLISEGTLICKIQQKQIDYMSHKFIKASIMCDNINYNIWLGTGNLVSDLGNCLCKKPFNHFEIKENKDIIPILPDFVAIWNYDTKTDEWYISLRGSEFSPDLSKISRHFDGGGHKCAAGFTIRNKHLRDIFTIE